MGRTFAVLFALALMGRILFFAQVKPWDPAIAREVILEMDAGEYHDLATTLVQYHRFARTPDEPPNAYRTPGYPLFVAAVYAVVGGVPWIVLLVQIVLDAVTCVLTFVMIAGIMGYREGLIGGVVYAVDPFLIMSSVSLLSDTLFIFLCVLGGLFFARAIRDRFARGSRRDIALAAVVWALATLVRPTTQFLVLLVPVVILWIGWKRKRDVAINAGVFATIFVLVLAPWVARNAALFGKPALSTSGDYNLLILYAVPMEVEKLGASSDTVAGILLREADDLMRQEGHDPARLNDFQKSPYWQRVALRYIVREPARFFKLSVLGIVHTFANLSTRRFADMLGVGHTTGEQFDMKMYSGFLELAKQFIAQKSRGELWIGIWVGLVLCVFYVFLAVGLVVAWSRYDRVFLAFCLIMTLYFTVISGPYGLARYRLPAIPFYACFIAAGLTWTASRLSTLTRRPTDS